MLLYYPISFSHIISEKSLEGIFTCLMLISIVIAWYLPSERLPALKNLLLSKDNLITGILLALEIVLN